MRKTVEELRDELKNYYGTAAVVMGNGSPFGFVAPAMEMFRIDDLSDEEVIEKAESLGLI